MLEHVVVAMPAYAADVHFH
jgi:hypothetical protein